MPDDVPAPEVGVPGESPVATRRRFLRLAVGAATAVAVAGATGYELVEHGLLPGKRLFDRWSGACDLPRPPLHYRPLGPSESGQFYSAARRQFVGYCIGYPPGYHRGDEIPLVVMLHGRGDNHRTALSRMTPAQAVALSVGGRALTPIALVTVDGGSLYWNPHPEDDPMAMVVDELIPFCQRRGLGRSPSGIAMMGISMGGYGALEIAERYPGLVSAVAAISPAVWLSDAEASDVDPDAFSSPAAFAAGDIITHAGALRSVAVRVASSYDDPFYPNVQQLARVLPRGSEVVFSAGCHDSSFFLEQEPPSLAFLSAHLGPLSRRLT
jgi:enterochelin esterase-like enzyme